MNSAIKFSAPLVEKVFLQVQADVNLDLEGTLGQNGG
jgi:hypothetical protein